MSFLLRNRNPGGGGAIIVPPATSRDRGSNTVTPKSTTGIRSGNQMLLQRQAIQVQRTGQYQSRKLNQDQASHGVISMNEVLADLKVLEQQQRDSQQKLASARQLMEHRNQQSTALDTKLGSLKYSNGELRAQITQYRDLLSVSNRFLGSRKLIANRASGDIRNFEKNLKKGLMSSRVNAAILSKIDSVLNLLETKATRLTSIKITLKSKLAELESQCVSQAKKDESTRNEVHQQVSRFQEGAIKLSTIRTESITFQKDFLAAQNMEETTRTRIKTVKAEISTASQQAEEELSAMSTYNEDIVKNADALDKENATLALDVDEQRQVLKALQAHQDPVFDGTKVAAALESCKEQVDIVANINTTMYEDTERMRTHLFTTSQAAAKKISESKAIVMAAEELMASEQARAKELALFKSELQAERQSLEKLEKSSQELEETRYTAATELKQTLLLCDQEQETARREIDRLKQAIEQGTSSYEAKEIAWNATKTDLLGRLGGAQASYKGAESLYSSIEQKSKKLDENFEGDLQKELSVIRNDMTEGIRHHGASIAEVLRRHPMLQSIVSGFVHDCSITYEEHSKLALGSLKEDLRNMIRKVRDARKTEHQDHKNAELKLKRNEEGRRKNRQHIEAELKRQQVAPQVSAPASGTAPPNMSSTRHEVSTGARKSAEFFNPASQEESSEEETPAQPKSLLSSFANARSLPYKSSIDLTPNSHKHVHWKEDKKSGEAVVESSVAHQPKVTRKSKHYGTSQRGLAAISGPKKSGTTKRSSSVLSSGKESDDSLSNLVTTSNTLPPSGDSKRQNLTSFLGNSEDATTKSSVARLSNSTARLSGMGLQASFAARKSAIGIPKSHHSATSQNSSKDLLEQKADHRQDKLAHALGFKANNSSTRLETSPRRLPANRDSNVRSHRAVSSKEKSSKSSVGKSPSRRVDTIIPKTASSSHSVALESSRPSSHSESSGINKPSSRSGVSKMSHNSGNSRAEQGPMNRKRPMPISSTQTSGLSSCEGVHKARRRKKSTGSQRGLKNATDDSYAYAF